MKNFLGTTLILCFMLPVFSFAFELGSGANIYFTNNYFWRITPLEVKDPHVQYDFSKSISFNDLELSITPWISYNLSTTEVDEVDYTLDIAYTINDSISTNAGVIYYDVTGVPETMEMYAGMEYGLDISNFLSFSPGLTFFYDIKEVKAGYLEPYLSLGTPKFPYVTTQTTLGIDLGQFELEDKSGEIAKTKLTTLQIGISAEYEIYKDISLSPGFTYVIGLHDAIENTSYFGFKISFGF